MGCSRINREFEAPQRHSAKIGLLWFFESMWAPCSLKMSGSHLRAVRLRGTAPSRSFLVCKTENQPTRFDREFQMLFWLIGLLF